MKTDYYYEIFNRAPKASEEQANKHLKEFVDSFVLKNKKDRWFDLLYRRPKKISELSHKLEGCLDIKFCSVIFNADNFANEKEGVYYDFLDSSLCLSGNEALILGAGNEAIYSIVPGSLALLFSHEGRVWVCKR